MFCNKCGKKIDDNSKFCIFCGYRTDGKVIEKPISMPTNEEPTEEIKTEPIFEEEIEEVVEEPLEEQAEEEIVEIVQEESTIEEVVEEPLEEQAEEEIVEMVQEELKEEPAIEEVVEEALEEQAEEENVEMTQEESKKESEVIVVEEAKEQPKQPITEEQEKLIEKYKKRKHTKEIKEKVSGGFKVFLNVLWVIFGGLYNAISVIIAAVVECITLVGIPFGIVLFKTVPLMFMPIGKRVVTHYGRHPIANTLWLIFGGFFYALGYTISAILLCLTIIGIPVAIQMFKVSNILWAPFGAEILRQDEFSSSEKEILAYTIQYVRRERIVVDLNKLNCDYKEADIIRNICDINCPLSKATKSRKANALSIILPILIFLGVYGLFQIVSIFNVGELINVALNYLNIPPETFANIPVGFPAIILFVILILLVFVSIFSKKFTGKSSLDYGYGTRKELVSVYDSGYEIDNKTASLVYVIYKLYQKEIDLDIIKDKNTKKEDE